MQADKALAHKVYAKQSEHIQEACKDHELAKHIEVRGDIALKTPKASQQQQGVSAIAEVRVIYMLSLEKQHSEYHGVCSCLVLSSRYKCYQCYV